MSCKRTECLCFTSVQKLFSKWTPVSLYLFSFGTSFLFVAEWLEHKMLFHVPRFYLGTLTMDDLLFLTLDTWKNTTDSRTTSLRNFELLSQARPSTKTGENSKKIPVARLPWWIKVEFLDQGFRLLMTCWGLLKAWGTGQTKLTKASGHFGRCCNCTSGRAMMSHPLTKSTHEILTSCLWLWACNGASHKALG